MTDVTDGTSPDAHRPPGQVQQVYDEIAPHFSKTRAYPWPEVETFLAEWADREGPPEDGSERVGLDVGCGNGRHTALLSGQVGRVVGLDLSRALLGEARERVTERQVALVQADAAALPVRAGVVDVALYIATVHHLPDRETRVESLRELARVLDAEGRALVSAWSTAHDQFDADAGASEGFDTTVDWTLPGGETVPRFYHIYAPAEFERDLREAGLTVESSVVSSGNCYAEVESKISEI